MFSRVIATDRNHSAWREINHSDAFTYCLTFSSNSFETTRWSMFFSRLSIDKIFVPSVWKPAWDLHRERSFQLGMILKTFEVMKIQKLFEVEKKRKLRGLWKKRKLLRIRKDHLIVWWTQSLKISLVWPNKTTWEKTKWTKRERQRRQNTFIPEPTKPFTAPDNNASGHTVQSA